MLDGLSLEQESADFGVEAGGLFHVRGMTGVGDDDEAGSVDAIAHLFTAEAGRAGIIGAPHQERRNRYAAECFGEVGMHGARWRVGARRVADGRAAAGRPRGARPASRGPRAGSDRVAITHWVPSDWPDSRTAVAGGHNTRLPAIVPRWLKLLCMASAELRRQDFADVVPRPSSP